MRIFLVCVLLFTVLLVALTMLSPIASAHISEGVLDPWQSLIPMENYRTGLAVVAANGYLYALGGSQFGGTINQTVERAKINTDGSIGTWITLNSILLGRSHFAAVAAHNYIYAIGGDSYGSEGASTVERALILPDGSLGEWEFISEMTSGRYGLAAVVANGYLYVIGGSANENTTNPVTSTVTNTVERTRINADGSLGSWETLNSMIEKRHNHAAVAANGYIYAIGGSSWIPPLSSVEYARINNDGSLGIWQTTTELLFPRQYFSAVAVGGHIFIIGGVTNTDVQDAYRLDDVHEATMNQQDGSLVTWEITSSLMTGRQGHGAAQYNEFIFVVGGASDLYGILNSVERAMILADTTPPVIETFQINSEAVTTPATDITLKISASDIGTGVKLMSFSNNGYAWSDWQSYLPFISWTLDSGDGLKTVYARVLDSAGNMSDEISDTIELDTSVGTEFGLSINSGAIYTNNTDVILTISSKPNTTDMQLSNDGGFSGTSWEPYSSQKSWTITQYGDYVIPRIVYTRYRDVYNNISSVFQDDIILDVNPPTGSVTITPNSEGGTILSFNKFVLYNLPIDNYPYITYLPLVNGNICRDLSGATNVTLQLDAQDDVSGVGSMMISNQATFDCGVWEPYLPTKGWFLPDGNSEVYVKFRDNAENISAVILGKLTP